MSVSIDVLCARVRALPDAFQISPSAKDAPHLDALLADTLLHLSNHLPQQKVFNHYLWSNITKRNRNAAYINYLALLYVVSWLLHDPSLRSIHIDPEKMQKKLLHLMEKRLKPLAKLVDISAFIRDTDRREELVRICLDSIGASIEDEDEQSAQNRLQALDSVARHQLIEKAKKRRREEEQKRKLEQERIKRKQQEQAARYNRE